MLPLPERCSPVSDGRVAPCPNSRFRLPDGEPVLLPAASACHSNVSLTGVLMVLLTAEACRLTGCEFFPAAAVAVPVVGKLSVPRMVAPPFTSRVEAGDVVPMPIFAELPEPD